MPSISLIIGFIMENVKIKKVLRGGVKVPTGGNPADSGKPASVFLRGKALTRCESGADGNSPDGRDRFCVARLPGDYAFGRFPLLPLCRPDA